MSLSKALPPSAISTSLLENNLNLLFYLLKTPYFTGKETIAVTALIFPKLKYVRTFILDQLSETKKTFLEFHVMNILKEEDEHKTITGMAHVRLDSIRYKLHAAGVYTNCSASAQKMLHTLSVYLARFNDCPERWLKERIQIAGLRPCCSFVVSLGLHWLVYCANWRGLIHAYDVAIARGPAIKGWADAACEWLFV
ncbi:hypothetical protein BDV12DRAFT_204595 [Aspergillus spectabilis]